MRCAAKTVAAIADSQSGELAARRMGGATEQVADFCAGLPAPVRVAYEADPTGFGLARALKERDRPLRGARPRGHESPGLPPLAWRRRRR